MSICIDFVYEYHMRKIDGPYRIFNGVLSFTVTLKAPLGVANMTAMLCGLQGRSCLHLTASYSLEGCLLYLWVKI